MIDFENLSKTIILKTNKNKTKKKNTTIIWLKMNNSYLNGSKI